MVFLREFVRHFRLTGAVTPSSRLLARKMVQSLPVGDGIVVELGPGTGVFTEELLRSGLSVQKLLAVEYNPAFATRLRQKFPHLNVVQGDAADLASHLEAAHMREAAGIISALPFRSLPVPMADLIVDAIGQCLRPGGVLVQFTYAFTSPLSPSQMKRARLQGQRVEFVMANLPPAHVWRYVKDL